MPSSTNGRYGGPHDPIRRLRYDEIPALMEKPRGREPRAGSPAAGTAATTGLGPSHSGRWFVILAVIAVLIVWGLLYVVFREWRARYRVRAAYGASQVAPAIDVFAEIKPPGIDRAKWRDAVARTHATLVTVTASNLLGLPEMRELRGELQRAAARAREKPETAVAELAAVWDDLSERGEFLMRDTRALDSDRHPRPSILPNYGADRVAPGLDPLDRLAPPGVDPARWREAVASTRTLVLEVTRSRLISTMRMMELRKEIDRAIARAQARPGSAVGELAAVWDAFHKAGMSLFPDRKAAIGQLARPEIFPPR